MNLEKKQRNIIKIKSEKLNNYEFTWTCGGVPITDNTQAAISSDCNIGI